MMPSYSLVSASAFAALWLSTATATYTWPDPRIDQLESILYEHSGATVNSPVFGVAPCDELPADRPRNGRTNAAEWVRTAYHDMATADAVAGTGGIDASIGFEFADRAENPGLAFDETLLFLLPFHSPRSSMSDLIALAAVQAVGSCSAGRIGVPFRGGRIDATEAGPFGVPEPQQSLESHEAAFLRQGFNVTEMIGLVACGHTLGGVHAADFPEIVPVVNDTHFDDNRYDFDSTMASFDNSVAVQFVNNETQNPLAFGQNETTNSDKRIFNADGGSYIHKMAESSGFFDTQCSTLLERMINTVPSSVQLTDVITPISVKPTQLGIKVNTDGTMTISGIIRLIEDTSVANRQVFVDFKPRNPESCASCDFGATAALTTTTYHGLYAGIPTFNTYQFNVTTPTTVGVSSFTVRIEDDGASTVADNNGLGFPFPDSIAPQISSSCLRLQTIQGVADGMNITVAVRDDLELSEVAVSVSWPVAQNGSTVARFETSASQLSKLSTLPLNGTGYTAYSGSWSGIRNKFSAGEKLYYDIKCNGPSGALALDFQPWAIIPKC